MWLQHEACHRRRCAYKPSACIGAAKVTFGTHAVLQPAHLKAGVAEVGHQLRIRLGNCGSQAERVHSPLEVAVPPLLLQGQTLAQSGLIHLQPTEFQKSCMCAQSMPNLISCNVASADM